MKASAAIGVRASGPAVEVHELSKRFGDFVAVDRVSFAVAPGEVFGFLGPNGAGKTTTIKMLNGLLAPSSGSGRVAGFDIASERSSVKSAIGYMSQLFSLYGDLTVDENIRFFAGLYGVAGSRLAARREWVIEMAGLAGQSDRPAGELALGWKQRLALGCAVLHEPPILFLDEPTVGIDIQSRAAIWDLLHEVNAGGTTVLYTSHHLEEAERLCTRVVVMDDGRSVGELSTTRGGGHERLEDAFLRLTGRQLRD